MSKTSAVSFTVDLGEVALVSGFQSQGPPRSKHGADYLRYVGLRVLLSDDGRQWRGCCQDRQELVSGFGSVKYLTSLACNCRCYSMKPLHGDEEKVSLLREYH